MCKWCKCDGKKDGNESGFFHGVSDVKVDGSVALFFIIPRRLFIDLDAGAVL